MCRGVRRVQLLAVFCFFQYSVQDGKLRISKNRVRVPRFHRTDSYIFITRTVEVKNEIGLKFVYGNTIGLKTEIQKLYLKLLKTQDEALLPSQHGWYDCIDVVILNASRIFKIRLFFCTKLIPLCMATLTCL